MFILVQIIDYRIANELSRRVKGVNDALTLTNKKAKSRYRAKIFGDKMLFPNRLA